MLVRPVYLAGHGDTQLISGPLDAADGWDSAVTTTGIHYTSPCRRARITHLPEVQYGGWKVTEYRKQGGTPVWSANFSENAPAEITAAFTTTLLDGLRSNHRDYLLGGPHYQPASPATILADRGWQTDDARLHLHQRSPDGHAYVSLRKGHLDDHEELSGDGPPLWTMCGGVEEADGEQWRATFTSGTPLYLVHQAALALSSTEPVVRPLSAIPGRNLPYLTAWPADPPPKARRSAALARTPNAQHIGAGATAAPALSSRPSPSPGRAC